jgi:hypothetical protein
MTLRWTCKEDKEQIDLHFSGRALAASIWAMKSGLPSRGVSLHGVSLFISGTLLSLWVAGLRAAPHV